MNSVAQRWESLKERLRFRYGPRCVDWLLDISTAQARAKRKSLGPLRILVDNTVLFHAVTHETAWISTGTSHWGTLEFEGGYAARVPVHAATSDARVYKNVTYLPGVAHLCQAGQIQLFTSSELQDEQSRQPIGRYRGYGYFDYNLFRDLVIPSIDGYSFLTELMMDRSSPGASQRARIGQHRRDSNFDALVRALGDRNSQDAWHIYTAHKHQCFCFLTMDFKLINAVRSQQNNSALMSINTKVLTPEMLGYELGFKGFPHWLFAYHNASFPVRTDLSMPNEMRRPLKEYKRRDR